jgi:Fe-S-cluster-containing hydrogenase component 2
MTEYCKRGYLLVSEIGEKPSEERLRQKKVAFIECPQEIPCNACVHSCKFDAVLMDNINAPPKMDYDACTGCMRCIRVCPGLAIFMLEIKDDMGRVTMPYEFLPVPEKGETVKLLNREGKEVGEGTVTWVLPPERNEGTALVTVEMNKDLIYEVRAFRVV